MASDELPQTVDLTRFPSREGIPPGVKSHVAASGKAAPDQPLRGVAPRGACGQVQACNGCRAHGGEAGGDRVFEEEQVSVQSGYCCCGV